MGWRFYGYAAVYGSPDNDGDVFTHHCFVEFLTTPDHLAVPMLNAHQPPLIGRWLRMIEDGYGLLVWGETFSEVPPVPELPDPSRPASLKLGLSVKVREAKGPPQPNCWGGKTCRWAAIEEISLVVNPTHSGSRILGEWTAL